MEGFPTLRVENETYAQRVVFGAKFSQPDEKSLRNSMNVEWKKIYCPTIESAWYLIIPCKNLFYIFVLHGC